MKHQWPLDRTEQAQLPSDSVRFLVRLRSRVGLLSTEAIRAQVLLAIQIEGMAWPRQP